MENTFQEQQNLQESVKALYDMELNNCLMTRAIQLLDVKIQQLCVPRVICPPRKEKAVRNFTFVFALAPFGAILGAIVGLFVGCEVSDWSHPILNVWSIFARMLVFGVVGLLVASILGLVIDILALRKVRKREELSFQEEEKRFSIQKKREEQRIEAESQQRWILLENKRILVNKRKESRDLLNNLYNVVGIDDNFRSLVCMGYMYEYLRLGIATRLEGTDGLYKQIIDRCQWDILHEDIERLSNKIDQLINQNDRIYHELHAIHAKCDNIIASTEQAIKIGIQNGTTLQQIQENTQISAYNQERLRIEYEYNTLFNLRAL